MIATSPRVAAAFALLTSLAAPAAADQLVVPDDYTWIQQAIDAAAPGDVILVKDSAGALNSQPLIIDKPLTIVGQPFLELEVTECANFPIPNGAVWLDGPGSGTVTLIGLRRENAGFDCPWPAPFVGGGGFDALHVYDSDLLPASGGQTGSGNAGVAIDADVARVLVVNSTIRGGSNNDYDCYGMYGDAGTAIRLPGGTVVAVDSTITGGQGYYTCCTYCDCPTDLSGWLGQGGTGVEAAVLWSLRSTVEGGEGAMVSAHPSQSSGSGTPCCQLPSGDAMIVGQHLVLDGDLLLGSGPMLQGEDWVLSWELSSPLAQLFWSTAPGGPLSTAHGVVLLDLATLVDLGPIPGGTGQLTVTIPSDPVIIGGEVVVQAFGVGSGLSQPVLTAVVP